MDDALRVAKDGNARGIDALVNHLGEHYRDKTLVEATTREYLQVLASMSSGGIRGTVSLKPTQFGVLIDKAYALSQMIPVLDAAKAEIGRASCRERCWTSVVAGAAKVHNGST